MCGDPMTMMIGLTALQGVAQVSAQRQQADAQAAQYKAQADAYSAQAAQERQNALIEQGKSKQIAAQYAEEQQKLDDKRRLVRGQNLAAQGASGMVGGTGTGLDVLNAGNTGYVRDSMNLLRNQRMDTTDSWINQTNHINQANQFDASASSYRTAARNTKKEARAAMFGTILGTAASMAGIWNKWGSAGTTASANPHPSWVPGTGVKGR